MVESDGTTMQIPGSGASGTNVDEKIWKHLSEQNREKWTVAQVCGICTAKSRSNIGGFLLSY